MVDQGQLQRIKQTDESPEIRAYTVGHTGDANLHIPGVGLKTFTWVQAAVRWIADKLNVGTPIFNRHDPTSNEHTGRTKIGEVVGRAYKEVGDKLSAIAAVYLYPQYKSMPLDVASIEADITFDHDTVQAWPTSVERITGIALSNSGVDSPGFPGATLIGAVQAFAVQAFAGENVMTKEEIKAEVARAKMKPSEVFGLDEIKADSTVDSWVRDEKHNVYEQNQRLTKELDEARDKLTKSTETYEAKLKDATTAVIASKKSTVFDKLAAERKLNDQQKKYLGKELQKLDIKVTDETALRDELNKWVDTGLEDFKEVASILGIKLDTQKKDDGEGDKEPDPAPVTRQTDSETPVDAKFLDPKVNPLIPGSTVK